MLVLLSIVLEVSQFYRFLNMRFIPFFLFSFYGKDGEDRTSDLTVHNVTPCLRRQREEID